MTGKEIGELDGRALEVTLLATGAGLGTGEDETADDMTTDEAETMPEL